MAALSGEQRMQMQLQLHQAIIACNDRCLYQSAKWYGSSSGQCPFFPLASSFFVIMSNGFQGQQSFSIRFRIQKTAPTMLLILNLILLLMMMMIDYPLGTTQPSRRTHQKLVWSARSYPNS